VVGDAKRQVENRRVEEVVSSGNVEADLRKALEVSFLLVSMIFVLASILLGT
jgi:hypothetical protein